MSIWLVCSLPLCPWLKAQWKLPPLSWLGCSDSRSSSPPLQKWLAKNTLHVQWLEGIFSKPIIIVISCINYTIPAHCEVAWWMQYASQLLMFLPLQIRPIFFGHGLRQFYYVSIPTIIQMFVEGYWGMILCNSLGWRTCSLYLMEQNEIIPSLY